MEPESLSAFQITFGKCVIKLTLVIGVSFSIAACDYFEQKSYLHELLIQKYEDGSATLGVGYFLYDTNSISPRVDPSAEVEVRKLIEDGFLLDVGEGKMPGWQYVQCGDYMLPLDEKRVLLRRIGNLFLQNELWIEMSIDDNCQILNASGSKLNPTRM